MSETTVRFIVTSDDGEVMPSQVIPTKAHADDAAFDIRAAEEVNLFARDTKLVNTGIALAIPEGYAGLVMPRSGLALKHAITVLNGPGLIDPGYRGDIGVILHNAGHEPFHVKPGDRIAQLLFIKTADVELRSSAWLSHSEREDAGFGSTGVA